MTKTAASKIDKTNELDLNTPKCTIFGSAKDNHPSCMKCAKTLAKRNEACKELTLKTAKTPKVKKIAGTSLDCFGCNVNEDTHLFIMEVYKNPSTMKAIKACSWNKRPNTFYCKAKTLVKNGYMLKSKKSKTFSLSAKGRKLLEKWIESRKAENRKTA